MKTKNGGSLLDLVLSPEEYAVPIEHLIEVAVRNSGIFLAYPELKPTTKGKLDCEVMLNTAMGEMFLELQSLPSQTLCLTVRHAGKLHYEILVGEGFSPFYATSGLKQGDWMTLRKALIFLLQTARIDYDHLL